MNNFETPTNQETPRFGESIKREVRNFLTGEKYQLIGGKLMDFSDDDIEKIVKICSQKNTYEILFKERLDGHPYTTEAALGFVNWVKEGWENNTHFVFFVRKIDGEIIGAIDIKSSDLMKAEIGYWADENFRGFMTNTVQELSLLAKTAGFSKLVAGALATNSNSVSVLERSGFTKITQENQASEAHVEYEKNL